MKSIDLFTNQYNCKKWLLSLLVTFVCFTYSSAQSPEQNYIQVRTMTNSTGTSYMDKIQYYDGLGRPVETLQKGFTPKGDDLVTIQEYDNFGRESNLWLPTPYAGSGSYVDPATIISASKTTYNDNSPYSSPVYEASPLNRVLEKYGPGENWRTSGASVKSAFYTNDNNLDSLKCAYYYVTSDNKLVKSGNYDNGQLYVTRTMDEENHKVFEFKDKLGQVVLIRQINNDQNYDTYYVYDDFGNRCFVLPPLAADGLTDNTYDGTKDVLQKYAYMYRYDYRNRCIWKKLPGAEGINMIYDKADHLVFTQDGVQGKRHEWTFSISDAFNRVVITGVCSDTISIRNTIVNGAFVNGSGGFMNTGYQLSISSPTSARLLTVSYYDNYDFRNSLLIDPIKTKLDYVVQEGYAQKYVNAVPEISAKGMLTGTRVFMLEDPTKEIITAMYYDDRGRLAQSRSTNHLGGYENNCYSYTFTGKISKHQHEHFGIAEIKEVYKNYYDYAERLIKTVHLLNNADSVTLVENTYDDLGRLQTKKQHGTVEITTYNYNIRSWLTSINSDRFKQNLFYEKSFSGSAPYYNGNINAMNWQVKNDIQRVYKFTYDNLDRILAAKYSEIGQRDPATMDIATDDPSYDEEILKYDKHGNIKQLCRTGLGRKTISNKEKGLHELSFLLLDNMDLEYNGNQLIYADDNGVDGDYAGAEDFVGLGDAYNYDANGNTTAISNKDLMNIKYNLLNLPSEMQYYFGHTASYLYDANGVKRKVKYTVTDESIIVPIGTTAEIPKSHIVSQISTDYCGNIIYENGVLNMILTNEGFITMNGSTPTYHYYLKDHQGNNRVVFNQSGTIEQSNHYYPSGIAFGEGINTSGQRYKYNGKELDKMNGLNWHDYGARHYDAAIGRWGTVDPHAEKYYSISPYAYCLNNPVRFTDPDGREVRIKGDEKYRKETFNNLQQLSSSKLVLLKNGKVVEASSYKGKSSQISLTGAVTGNGKDKVNGTALVHDVISDKHTATIQAGKENEFNPTSQINASTAKVGSGGILSFNNEPTGVVRGIANQNGPDHVSDQSVLGHELLHARHSFQGTVNYKTVDVQDPDRNNWTFPMSREELRTRRFENYIRSEQGDEPRAQPTINN